MRTTWSAWPARPNTASSRHSIGTILAPPLYRTPRYSVRCPISSEYYSQLTHSCSISQLCSGLSAVLHTSVICTLETSCARLHLAVSSMFNVTSIGGRAAAASDQITSALRAW